MVSAELLQADKSDLVGVVWMINDAFDKKHEGQAAGATSATSCRRCGGCAPT